MRTKLITALGLSAILALTSTSVYQRQPRAQKLIDSYKIKDIRKGRTFIHYETKNIDSLFLHDSFTIYDDDECDGIVDRIYTDYRYSRGDPNTNSMFQEADQEFNKAKRDLGIK